MTARELSTLDRRMPLSLTCANGRRLAGFVDAAGRSREVVTCAAPSGGELVIDRDAGTLADARLIAHLAVDEPSANADLVCRRYLADARRGRPRPVTTDDLIAGRATAPPRSASPEGALVDGCGGAYRLLAVPAVGMGIPEVRWFGGGPGEVPRVVRLREVIGLMQSYEPARELTAAAVAAGGCDSGFSVAVLRAELERIGRSRIVLNRGLREAVLRAMAQEGLSMSCIALRCGRVKRDRRGNLSGETSWLARRLGLAPEGGEKRPTPWIHSDVLALIARCGLGIAPREVELG